MIHCENRYLAQSRGRGKTLAELDERVSTSVLSVAIGQLAYRFRSISYTTNRDPITGAPGSHPVGTAAGATSGGVAGAAVGTVVGGPVGGAVGAAVGAVAGGLAGHAAGEAVNPSVEDIYWRQAHIRERITGRISRTTIMGRRIARAGKVRAATMARTAALTTWSPSCEATISASRANRGSPGRMRRPRPALPGIASSAHYRGMQTTTVARV
jgi:hypothetical protein